MGGKSITPFTPGSGRKKGIQNEKRNWRVIWFDSKNSKMHYGEFTSAQHMSEDPIFHWLGHRSKLHYYFRKSPKPELFIERLTKNAKCKDLQNNNENCSDPSEESSELLTG